MNPFSALLKSLQSVFDLEALRHDKYVFAPIQRLKIALDHYKPEKQSFVLLLEAVVDSRPFIEKWQINFDEIKICMEALAKKQGMKKINWEHLFENQKKTPRFFFSATSNEELISWLESKERKPFFELNPIQKTKILVENVESSGFSKKLAAYLDKHPDFLFRLAKKSAQNFINIANSRLSLFLTDKQLAIVIIKHAPKLMVKYNDRFMQTEKFMEKLNEILSNGRSVATLLRNEDAKKVLEKLKHFRHYQSEEYRNRHESEEQGFNKIPSL